MNKDQIKYTKINITLYSRLFVFVNSPNKKSPLIGALFFSNLLQGFDFCLVALSGNLNLLTGKETGLLNVDVDKATVRHENRKLLHGNRHSVLTDLRADCSTAKDTKHSHGFPTVALANLIAKDTAAHSTKNRIDAARLFLETLIIADCLHSCIETDLFFLSGGTAAQECH